MKKLILYLLGLLLLLSACAPAGQPAVTDTPPQPSGQKTEKLSVITTIYPHAYFVERVGGNQVHVTTLIAPGVEAHDWEPTAQDIVRLGAADLLVLNGLGMEPWADKVVSTLPEGGPKVISQQVADIDSSKAHEHSETDHDDDKAHEHKETDHDDNGAHEHKGTDHDDNGSHEHKETDHDDNGAHEHKGTDHDDGESHEHKETDHDSHGHHHDVDPHVWLDPQRIRGYVEAIRDALISLAPQHQAEFTERASLLDKELQQLDQDFRDRLTALSRKTLVVSHDAFGYLCDAYGLEQVAIDGLAPNQDPSPARLAEIIEIVKSKQVKAVFFTEQASDKLAATLGNATGAAAEVLYTLESVPQTDLAAGEDYFSLMRKNLDAISRALAD